MSKFPYNWKLKNSSFSGKKGKGTVFSCFACGGGSTMGYKLAGFNVLGCNEIDPKMMEVYKANHNPKYSYLEPIQTFKIRKDLPKKLYNLDILDGSPPCSSFSMAGNREKDWGKKKKFREGQAKQVLDNLFFDFIDLAKELQPKIVVVENVKGILMGSAMSYRVNYVAKIYKAFDEAGYYCKHWLLDASKMGIPQRRERVFFICLRKDLAKSSLIQKDFISITPKLDLVFNKKKIKYKDIYFNLNDRPLTAKSLELWKERKKTDKGLSEANGRLYNKPNNYFGYTYILPEMIPPTIIANDSCVIFKEPRFFNKIELCKIGSFPLDYNFLNLKPQYIIGMSVPPVMMANIADRIYKQILKKL